MNLQARIDSLRTKHATLDTRLLDEDHRPAPDRGTISRLKLEKLRVKDEMERLRLRP